MIYIWYVWRVLPIVGWQSMAIVRMCQGMLTIPPPSPPPRPLRVRRVPDQNMTISGGRSNLPHPLAWKIQPSLLYCLRCVCRLPCLMCLLCLVHLVCLLCLLRLLCIFLACPLSTALPWFGKWLGFSVVSRVFFHVRTSLWGGPRCFLRVFLIRIFRLRSLLCHFISPLWYLVCVEILQGVLSQLHGSRPNNNDSNTSRLRTLPGALATTARTYESAMLTLQRVLRTRTFMWQRVWSHPTVGVALCGATVSDQLSSLREELPVRMKS